MEWVVALGLLILPLVILTSSVQMWLERGAIADTLAQEAARTMALAPDWSSGIVAIHGIEQRAETSLRSGLQPCPEESGCLAVDMSGDLMRGGQVRAEATVWMPGLVIPFIGEAGGFWVSAGHTEIVDPYRSFP